MLLAENLIKLLIVDDEPHFLNSLTRRLDLRHFDVTLATTGDEMAEAARWQAFDLALVNPEVAGMHDGRLFRSLIDEHPMLEVVLLVSRASEEPPNQARGESQQVLHKPAETLELFRVLNEAFQRRVKRKHGLSDSRLKQLLAPGQRESALSLLLRLRALDISPDDLQERTGKTLPGAAGPLAGSWSSRRS